LQIVTRHLQKQTEELSAARFRWRGWVLLGADGSRINCPRTQANEDGLGCAGKVRTAPQLLLLTLYHVATGLPWAWRRARGDGSERGMLLELLASFPKRTLLLADAGFVGFALLKALRAAEHAFVIRVGRNVSLLKKLGFAVKERSGTVYLWPQKRRGESPLVLRLVELRVGRKRMTLLTNLLDEEQLRDAELLELYRRRWGVEVMYRSLKQTMGKRTLRGDTPATARCELDWAMTGLWMLGLMAQRAGATRQWSPASALRVIRTAMGDPRRRVGSRRFSKLLRGARRDGYDRTSSKTARNWPHKKRESRPGVPKVRIATKQELAKIKVLLSKNQAA
jgi:Transposase DDE domain